MLSPTVFLNKVAHTIKKHQLSKSTDKILIALSGGADSVALLIALQELNYNCIAVHCNFHLRDKDADLDELFVRELCKKRKINLDVVHFETFKEAKKRQISIEMAARELRYNYFNKIYKVFNCQHIAVAHHRDDNNETMLLNLIRGTGLKGLIGIQYKRDNIIRPLLDCSKEEILHFLKSKQQDYVTDKSNFDVKYKRNKIRHQLLPLLREFNPSVDETLKETSEIMQDSYSLLQKAIKEAQERIVINHKTSLLCIDRKKILKETSPHLILFETLNKYGFNNLQIKELLQSPAKERSLQFSSDDFNALLYQEKIFITKNKNKQEIKTQLLIDKTTILTENIKIRIERLSKSELTEISKLNNCVCVDEEQISLPLLCRNYQEGDRFIPFGMKGSKLISDYFTDKKIPLFERKNKLVIEDTKQIIWLVGERIDNRCAITNKTKNVLRITFIQD